MAGGDVTEIPKSTLDRDTSETELDLENLHKLMRAYVGVNRFLFGTSEMTPDFGQHQLSNRLEASWGKLRVNNRLFNPENIVPAFVIGTPQAGESYRPVVLLSGINGERLTVDEVQAGRYETSFINYHSGAIVRDPEGFEKVDGIIPLHSLGKRFLTGPEVSEAEKLIGGIVGNFVSVGNGSSRYGEYGLFPVESGNAQLGFVELAFKNGEFRYTNLIPRILLERGLLPSVWGQHYRQR